MTPAALLWARLTPLSPAPRKVSLSLSDTLLSPRRTVLDSLSLSLSLSLWHPLITWPHEALHRGEGGRGEVFDAAERKRGERRRLECKGTLRMEDWHTHTRHARQRHLCRGQRHLRHTASVAKAREVGGHQAQTPRARAAPARRPPPCTRRARQKAPTPPPPGHAM